MDFKHLKELTREQYECHAWVLLGFQLILIFGSENVTATPKELVAYTGFYVEKALKEEGVSGLPLNLHNFNDSIMETKHKDAQQGKLHLQCWAKKRRRQERMITIDEYPPNNSVMSGHILKTEKRKALIILQTGIWGFNETSEEKGNGMKYFNDSVISHKQTLASIHLNNILITEIHISY